MLWTKRSLTVPVALLVLGMAGFLTYQVTGQRSGGAGTGCACVVSVNLPAVIDGLNQRAEAVLQLEDLRSRTLAEDEERKTRITQLREQLLEIPEADLDRREEAGEELARVALDYQAWRQFAMEQLDIEKSLMWRELDRVVTEAVAELAEISGYHLVLMDDSGQELGVNPESKISRELQVQQQMTSRRLLYVAPVADVTDELIERMNNAFNAGG